MRLNHPTPAIWAIVLLAAGFASNLFLTCGSNLVAFAVVAAVTLGFRRGSLVALGIWLESQVLGFTVFGYPHALNDRRVGSRTRCRHGAGGGGRQRLRYARPRSRVWRALSPPTR